MTEPTKPTPTSSTETTAPRGIASDMMPRAPSNADPLLGPRAALARVIPRRPRVAWWMIFAFAIGFATIVMPIITADHSIAALGPGSIMDNTKAGVTVRVPAFAGYDTRGGHIGGGGAGVVIARGDLATHHADGNDDEINAGDIAAALPRGPVPYLAFFGLLAVFAGLFSHHTRRSTYGRIVRVQVVNLVLIAMAAVAIKIAMLTTATDVLIMPIAVFALLPTLVLDRIVGLATGVLAALVVSLLVPFDVTVAILLLVQVATAGLVVTEHPKRRVRTVLLAGGAATLFTALTYPLLRYLGTGHLPFDELHTPFKSAWIAAALGPAIATAIALPLAPLYQLLVGEITSSKLIELEDLSHPLLKQIAERSPGTWQHSLMMANMAEIAANAIGANGRLVRVGAYFHDLGKSLTPKYFIENLEPGETSPHDKLPPEVSCDAIFAHVTEGIVTARRAGLHERIVDFMHMHHGNGVLEYFWSKCREQNNPNKLTVEHFRYPGVPPQSRETAILAICDAVEAASRTIKKAEPSAIENLVQRIVYGKLHLGQLDESGLSMSDLRKVADSLRETIRHANHNRIEYPWQKAEQSASATAQDTSGTAPRLDSLDRPARPDAVRPPSRSSNDDPYAETDAAGATPRMRAAAAASGGAASANAASANAASANAASAGNDSRPNKPRDSSELAMSATAPMRDEERQPGRDKRAMQARYGNDPGTSRESGNMTAPVERSEATNVGYDPGARVDSRVEDRPYRPAERVAPGEGTRVGYTPGARDSKPDVASDPMSSRDGSARVEHSRPSHGIGEPRTRGDSDAPVLLDRPSATPSGRATRESEPEIEAVPDERSRPIKRTDDTGRRRRATGDFVASMVLTPKPPPPERTADPAAPRDFAADIDTGKHRAALNAKDSTKEIAQFTKDAKRALDAAAKDIDVLPPGAPAPVEAHAPEPSARKRAATLPPTAGMLRPPTVPPPRRAPTIPPIAPPAPPERPPFASLVGVDKEVDRPVATTLGGPTPASLRSPARRLPGIIESVDDSARTQPAMAKADSSADDTNPNLELPLLAPAISDPSIRLPPPPPPPKPAWAKDLASRVDAQLDDDFGTETPVVAPTRAELQALLNVPPDATRKQSLEEVERLHRDANMRRSEPELEFTRRAPYPTAEVREEDIEAAIEVAPAARTRTGPIGVAKKKPNE